jgi:hypothetical protein
MLWPNTAPKKTRRGNQPRKQELPFADDYRNKICTPCSEKGGDANVTFEN